MLRGNILYSAIAPQRTVLAQGVRGEELQEKIKACFDPETSGKQEQTQSFGKTGNRGIRQ
ncbi:MAG: hypothetical protein EGP82_02700 [Odoribacter splanchnicus]|nr:hypothetical protein [Odoribacter splanchnicus]